MNHNIKALEFITYVSRFIGRLETDESVESVVSSTSNIINEAITVNIVVYFKMNRSNLNIRLVWDSKNPYKVKYELIALVLGQERFSCATSVYTNNFETDLSQMPWDLSGIMKLSNSDKYN